MDTAGIDYGKPPASGFAKLVCELYVNDLSASLAFWTDALEFQIAYQRPEERFVYLERVDGAQVMLYQPDERAKSTAVDHDEPKLMLQIFVDSLSTIVAKLEKISWPLLREPEDVWRRWGDRMGGKREIRFLDPDGNLLLVAEDIGERSL